MKASHLVNELVAQLVQHNDAVAYKQLFLFYHSPLIRFAFTFLRSKEAAEDVVSDVFLKIWTHRVALSNVQNFHLYLYVSTKNQCFNVLQAQKKAHFFSLDEVAVELRSLQYDPEQLLMTAELFKHIQTAIQNLPPRCRLIFKLVKEDGLKYKEVAELLHLSQKTIEAQMGIALQKIAAAISFKTGKIISI